jgi:predicted nucleotidyltransferase
VAKRLSVLDQLNAIFPTLKQRFGVSRMGLFGSHARGQGTDISDVDLLVSFSCPIGLEFFELQSYLEGRLHRRVDLVTEKALKPALRSTVLREVIKVG